jgi:hypothetical protein
MKIYALNASPRKGWNSDEMLESFLKTTEPEQLYIYNTLHWENPEKYQFPMEQYTDKAETRKINNSADRQSCYDAGVRFAEKVRQKVCKNY